METKSKRICDVCGKKFEKKFNMLQHRQIHQEGEEQFSCDKCPKTFTTRQYLVQHSKSHEENSILCEIFDKIFDTNQGLKKHIDSYHKLIVFLCQYCPKTFTKSEYARKHEARCRIKWFTKMKKCKVNVIYAIRHS